MSFTFSMPKLEKHCPKLCPLLRNNLSSTYPQSRRKRMGKLLSGRKISFCLLQSEFLTCCILLTKSINSCWLPRVMAMSEAGSRLRMASSWPLSQIMKKNPLNIILVPKYTHLLGTLWIKCCIVVKKMEGFSCGISRLILRKLSPKDKKNKEKKKLTNWSLALSQCLNYSSWHQEEWTANYSSGIPSTPRKSGPIVNTQEVSSV